MNIKIQNNRHTIHLTFFSEVSIAMLERTKIKMPYIRLLLQTSAAMVPVLSSRSARCSASHALLRLCRSWRGHHLASSHRHSRI